MKHIIIKIFGPGRKYCLRSNRAKITKKGMLFYNYFTMVVAISFRAMISKYCSHKRSKIGILKTKRIC